MILAIFIGAITIVGVFAGLWALIEAARDLADTARNVPWQAYAGCLVILIVFLAASLGVGTLILALMK